MSSIISSLAVIFLLCFIHISTSSSASRVLGAIVNRQLPQQNTTFQNPMENIEKVKEEEKTTISITPSSQVSAMEKKRKMRPKKQEQGHKSEHVINKTGRQSHRAAKRSSYSKNSSTKHPKVVSWRVPKMQDELPQTGFNLDYAPPKVHPPTHN